MSYVVKIKSLTGWEYEYSEPFETEYKAKAFAKEVFVKNKQSCEVLHVSELNNKKRKTGRNIKLIGVDDRELIFTTFAKANRFLFPEEPVTLLAHVFNEKKRRSFRGVKFERTNELPTKDTELSKFNLNGYIDKNKLIATTSDGKSVRHYKNITTAMNETTYSYRQIVDSIENGTHIDGYLMFKEVKK